jgi:DnaJ-class molecular chaperone
MKRDRARILYKANEIYKRFYSISDDMNKYPMCHDTALTASQYAVSMTKGASAQNERAYKFWDDVLKCLKEDFKQGNPVITCDTCNGSGLQSQTENCKSCSGFGVTIKN